MEEELIDQHAPRRMHVRQLFTALITAFGRKEFETFARYTRQDCEFDWPYLPLKEFPARLVGREAFVAMSKSGMAECDGYNHQVDTFYDLADPNQPIIEAFGLDFRNDAVSS